MTKCIECKTNQAIKDSPYCEKCQDKIFKVMAEYDEFIDQEMLKPNEEDKKFLEEIDYLFARRIKDFFEAELKEIGGCGFKLVDKPQGKKQNIYAIDYYVDQWTVGDSADCFEGYCYLRLANNKYLKWYYEC